MPALPEQTVLHSRHFSGVPEHFPPKDSLKQEPKMEPEKEKGEEALKETEHPESSLHS